MEVCGQGGEDDTATVGEGEEVEGGDGKGNDTCSISSPMALIAHRGAIYVSSSVASSTEILKIQGKRTHGQYQ
mgnify:CR=1 FL=1